MRFKLLRRRLTISSPRMAIRSAMPWPFRWAIVAIVLGFCGAIGLWAFEFGKDIAGLEKGSKEELLRLRTELINVRSELGAAKQDRDRAQSIANTADTLVTTEKASHQGLLAQLKQSQADNRALRDDLGFFERLIPLAGVDGLAIRSLQADLVGGNQLKWQVLVIQPGKNSAEFNGRLDVSFSGILDDKPWTANLAGDSPAIKVKQYGRMEGTFDIPAHVVVKGMSAKVMDRTVVKATQSIKL